MINLKAAILVFGVVIASITHSAQIELILGQGFDDATPVSAEGGNPGLTVGEQRFVAYRHAADLWSATLESDITINIFAEFADLFCNDAFASLGFAGPSLVFSLEQPDVVPNTWYPSALADALADQDLAAEEFGAGYPDVISQFNANINGNADCRDGLRWYYGLDGKAPDGTVDFLSVVMHEISHGLGFVSFTDTNSTFFMDTPDIYSVFSLDTDLGLRWNEMTDEQRQQSAVNTGRLVWEGAEVSANAASVLEPRSQLNVVAPIGFGPYDNLQQAYYGPPPRGKNFNGEVVLVSDGTGVDSDGCQALIGDVEGKIALIDRGGCPFEVKTLNAQAAGASAVIVANNQARGLPSMFGETTEARIPSVGMDFVSAEEIRDNLPGVELRFGFSPELLQGADDEGRVRLYAPPVFEPFSSVSHFDIVTTPDTLMEAFIIDGLLEDSSIDLTPSLLADIGWNLSEGNAFIEGCDTGVPIVDDSGLIAGATIEANDKLCRASPEIRYTECMTRLTVNLVLNNAISSRDFARVLACGRQVN